jgi:orotidine-5'-phosphate decarboxylase
LNVHAGGGAAMMQAASDAAQEAKDQGLRVPAMLGVTIMTSLADADLHQMGIAGTAQEQVLRLAHLAQKNGMDGVVCSAHEIAILRAELGPDFKLIVPGIRPAGSATQDQKRVMTPAEAQKAGADILVIGRPITGADAPRQAALDIAAQLSA